MINKAIKSKLARKELKQNKKDADDKKVNDSIKLYEIKQNSLETLSSAMKSRHARKDFKAARETYDPYIHQEKIREKRKEFERILTNKRTKPQVKKDTQKKYDKTNYLFKRRSNAGRPPTNPYAGLKQTNI